MPLRRYFKPIFEPIPGYRYTVDRSRFKLSVLLLELLNVYVDNVSGRFGVRRGCSVAGMVAERELSDKWQEWVLLAFCRT